MRNLFNAIWGGGSSARDVVIDCSKQKEKIPAKEETLSQSVPKKAEKQEMFPRSRDDGTEPPPMIFEKI